jgi:O-antigen/teichoic acid export membrane protein
MSDQSRALREVPPLFLAGVLINWAAMGLLAWRPNWIAAVGTLLSVGTLVMFVGAYQSRHRRASGRTSDDTKAELRTR